MKSTRLGTAYANALLFLILLVFITFALSLLAYMRFREDRDLHEGNPEEQSSPFRRPDKCLNKAREKRQQKQQQIDALQRQIERKDDALYQLQLHLAAHRTAYGPDSRWLLGTEANPEKTYRNENTATREYVSMCAERLKLWKDTHQSPDRQRFREMDQLIRDNQDSLHKVMQDSTAKDSQSQQEHEKLMQQLDQIEAGKREDDKKAKESESVLLTRRGNLDNRIRELLELDLRWLTELEPDGQILECNPERKFAVIDIGSVERVVRGLRLEVFQYDCGRYLRKGLAEVVEVQEHSSTCRIIREVDRHRFAMSKGDYVGSPVFDRMGPKTFVFAGEFENYNRSDLKRFIEAAGSRVADEIGPHVDFLVCGDHIKEGDRSMDAQDRARQYHSIRALRETYLLDFLQSSFRPLSAQEQQALEQKAAKRKPAGGDTPAPDKAEKPKAEAPAP